MKLTKDTVTILKNFGMINSNLILNPGNTISTISPGKNIIASSVVTEDFPSEFGIYDINEFLGALSLFEDPDLEFKDGFVKIKEDRNSIKYFSASTSILTNVPSIKAFPDPDIEFVLQSKVLGQLHKASSILKVENLSIVGDGADLSVEVVDSQNATSNSFSSKIGSTDKMFRANIKVDALKLLTADYKVAIGQKKICRFIADNIDLTYYVALDLDSKFEF